MLRGDEYHRGPLAAWPIRRAAIFLDLWDLTPEERVDRLAGDAALAQDLREAGWKGGRVGLRRQHPR